MVRVKLSPSDAANILKAYVIRSGLSNEKTGSHYSRSSDGREAIMMVFEKYYIRNSSRASLSVMIDDLQGFTSVYAIGSGGGQNVLFKFDWGASDNFERLVEKALEDYR